MQITEFANHLRQLQTKGSTPIFATVYHLAEALSDKDYSHLIMQSNMPCAFIWKEQKCPDSVFGLDCFFEPDYQGDFSIIEEGLRDLLDIRQKQYSVTHPQHGAYRKFSLPSAYLKGSEAWIRRKMEEILLPEREWRDCQASQIIQDILSHFASVIHMRVQFEGIWKDTQLDAFNVRWSTVYEPLHWLASTTGSVMRCSMLADNTTIHVFFNKAEGGKRRT